MCIRDNYIIYYFCILLLARGARRDDGQDIYLIIYIIDEKNANDTNQTPSVYNFIGFLFVSL